jgi:hypothetical protein
MRLYHYACHHERALLLREGMIRPWSQRFLGWSDALCWFTDLAVPTRAALGLNEDECDRTAYRFTIDNETWIVPWREYRAEVHPAAIEAVEGVAGALPNRWWVSEHPVILHSGAVRTRQIEVAR